ncbi:DeoR/GlpR family DNA-binding transcription regulator [Membranihabitans maritimus]|uniref:DeoR/GlpR family DNA-binding transcription regulator n=1 Tax=Membranihabitans maritimus TaxID=2904244 RepID=UPI001F2164FA|nr:DeoR/GlpR family DNA-binding transcription regulator [Membranihabitans maritimus]
MKLSERHEYILDKVKALGHIYVSELSEELQVSPVTIRKDLTVLEDRDLLFRTHGGASLQNPYIREKRVSEKIHLNYPEKLKIAKKAREMVKPGDSLLIGSGTTLSIFANQIKNINDLTVVTSSLQVALDLTDNPTNNIIILGGTLRNTSASSIGMIAEQMLDQYVCSKLFLSVDGIDVQRGMTTASTYEASLNRRMIQSADKLIALVDSTKIGKISIGKIGAIQSIDCLIMDRPESESTIQEWNSFGFTVNWV